MRRTPQESSSGTWQPRFKLALLASLSLLASLGLLAFGIRCAGADVTRPPNIVLILADDLGYGDLGCYGHPTAKTPRIDRLARQGIRFTRHYSNGPECSPTRTALLTGRYQQRAGGLECAIGTGNVGRYDDAIRLAQLRQLGLPADQVVLPTALRAAGYSCGVFGKWHLGYEPEFNPLRHGWHEFFGYLGGNVHYFNHRETSDLHVLFRGKLPVYQEGYMTHLITDEAISFLKRHTDQPFFLYVSHECPHFPFQGPDDIEKIVTAENWMEKDAETYVKMLQDLDSEVGRLLDALAKNGVAENTIVVFVSDNGGFSGAAHMAGLRGAKSTTFEGGIRVPLIVRYPGRIKPGSTTDQVSITFDLTHSFLAAAKAEISDDLEGIDILGRVIRQKPKLDRTLFWRGKRGTRTWSAVLDGDNKLVRKQEADKIEEWLFDLAGDTAEEHNLLGDKQQLAGRLKHKLRVWEADVKAVR